MCSRFSMVLVVGLLLMSGLTRAAETLVPGDTRIATWKGDAQAAFMLMFDDSIPSHVTNVAPELVRRGMTGTFYVNPGKHYWQQNKDAWEVEIPQAGMEYGLHTWSHGGVRNAELVAVEFGQCRDVIMKLNPPSATSPLLSYAQPGGIKKENWYPTAEEHQEILARYHLVNRPPFSGHGGGVNARTADELFALVEKALKDRSAGYVIFHGVGGDYLSVPMDVFTAFLDRVEGVRERLWIAGHIAVHKYETERESAQVEVTERSDRIIRLKLTTRTAPEVYDSPLTLVTALPENWVKCRIVQGGRRLETHFHEGAVRYDALPSAHEISLVPLK